MTVDTQEKLPVEPQPWALEPEDELDLRRHILTLFQWWREIILLTVLGGLGAVAYGYYLSQQQPDLYAASSDIILARVISSVNLEDDRITTTVDIPATDNTWRASLAQLAVNGTVALQVYNDLKDELPVELSSPSAILRSVSATLPTDESVRATSNILRITVRTPYPEFSAKIADSWARHLIRHVNTLYGEIPQETIDAVQEDLAAARREFEDAQRAYERFIAENRIEEYESELETKQLVRANLRANRRAILNDMVSADHNNRTALYSAIARTQTDNIVRAIEIENSVSMRILQQMQTRKRQAEIFLPQARGLVTVLERGGDPATSAEALRQIKLQLLASAPPVVDPVDTSPPPVSGMTAADMVLLRMVLTPTPSDVQLPEVDRAVLLADARALVEVIERNIAELDAAIAQQTERIINTPAKVTLGVLQERYSNGETSADSDTALAMIQAESYNMLFNPGEWVLDAVAYNADMDITQRFIDELERDISRLRAAIAAESAQSRQINQRRDLAWTSYDALSNKLSELNLMRTSANSQMRLASVAVPPLRPEPKRTYTLQMLGITGAAFLGAVVLVLLANLAGAKPLFARPQTR